MSDRAVRSRARARASAAVVASVILATATWVVPARAEGVGSAATVHEALTAPQIAGVMGRLGFRADAGEDDGGPLVVARRDDLSFLVLLFACDQALPPRCGQVQFRLGFGPVDGVAARDVAARWNLDRVFGRAVVEPTGAVALEHALHLNGGITLQNLSNNLALWHNAVEEFARLLGRSP